MNVIKNKSIFITISAVLVVLSILAVGFWGLDFGIDFTGGSIVEVTYLNERPDLNILTERIDDMPIGEFSLREVGENGYIIRTRFLKENEHGALLDLMEVGGQYELREERFNSVGPTIGGELQKKAYIAIAIVILAIILFIAFAFRKVSKPISSWKYGFVAIIALIHDIAIPTGLFALLGNFVGVEVDILFVMALLAILGFSVNDTIVVFDRVRENLRINQDTKRREPFRDIVGKSLSQTYARSLNTSITTLLVLLSLYLFGGVSTKFFALTLLVGVIFGTYSSIFLASPLLVVLGREKKEKGKKVAK